MRVTGGARCGAVYCGQHYMVHMASRPGLSRAQGVEWGCFGGCSEATLSVEDIAMLRHSVCNDLFRSTFFPDMVTSTELHVFKYVISFPIPKKARKKIFRITIR